MAAGVEVSELLSRGGKIKKLKLRSCLFFSDPILIEPG
jgi:hypothetical protein